MKNRYMFMINSLVGGGAERVMSTLLANSNRQLEENDVSLVLLDSISDAYPIPEHIKVHRLNSRGNLLRSLILANRVICRERPEAIVSFLTRSNIVNTALKTRYRHRAIISERAYTSSHFKPNVAGKISRAMIRASYPRADKIIAVSQGIRVDLIENFGARAADTVSIPNPVDVNRVRSLAKAPVFSDLPQRYIVSVGRLIKSKGFDLLINAFNQSTYSGHLLILGTGPERKNLEARAKELGLATRIHFLGFQENPFPIVAGARCFVLPSYAEGFPNSLVEAMALGVPVIATDCATGPSEIIDDRLHGSISDLRQASYGLLVPAGNPTQMAKAIDSIDEAFFSDYSRKSLDGAGRYDLINCVDAYWSVLAH